MTLARDPLSIEATLLEALRHLTEAEIEAATGKSASNFRAITNPGNRLQLSLKDAAALDAALLAKGMAPLFKAWFKGQRDKGLEKLGGRPPHRPEDVRRRVLALGALVGDINRIVHELGEREHDGLAAVLQGDLDRLVVLQRDGTELLDLLIKDAAHAKTVPLRRGAPPRVATA